MDTITYPANIVRTSHCQQVAELSQLRQWSYEQPPVFVSAQLRDELRSEIRDLGLAEVAKENILGD